MSLNPEFAILILAVAPLIVTVVKHANGIEVVRFPFLFSAVWLVFVIPKLIALTLSDNFLGTYYRDAGVTLAMNITASSCILSGLVGYFSNRPSTFPTGQWHFTRAELRRNILVASLLAIACITAVLLLAIHTGGLWAFFGGAEFYSLELRGAPVYLIYVARFVFVSIFVLAAILVRNRTIGALVILIAASSYPIANIIFLFRRSDLLMLGLIAGFVAITFYAARVPRLGVVGAVLGMLIAVTIFPLFRKMAMDKNSGIAQDLDGTRWVDQLKDFIEVKENNEIIAAAARFDYAMYTGDFGWGSLLWDSLVKQFVPRGIFGEEFKRSLFIDSGRAEWYFGSGWSFDKYFYLAPMGFSDAFEQLWYFAFILFFFLGVLVAWAERWRQRSFRGEIFYVSLLPVVVLSVSNDMLTLPSKILGLLLLVMLFPHVSGARRQPLWNRPAPQPRTTTKPPSLKQLQLRRRIAAARKTLC